MKAENIVLMRSWRMNQFPDLCDDATYQGQCVQNLLRRGNTKGSLGYQTFEVKFGSGRGTGIGPGRP